MATIQIAKWRHAAYYQTVLAAAEKLYLQGGNSVIRGLALFDLERTNIEAGHTWVVEQADDDKTATELCIAYSSIVVLDLRQHPHERIKSLETMLAAARR